MSELSPKVSWVMPVYNGEKYLRPALDSILAQTFKNWELVIVNDASTDSTPSICKEYAEKDPRIRTLTNGKNLHIGGSLNKGISAARADLIARMDADDICLPQRLEKQIKVFEENKDIAVVGSYIVLIDEEGKEKGIREYATEDMELKRKILRYSPFAHPTVMFKKSIVEEFGGYDRQKSPSEDIDLWFKIGTKYKFANVAEPLLKYRVFAESHSNKKLRNVEINTLQMRLNAVKNLGYKAKFLDILYNFAEFSTIYFMPAKFRIWLFNFLRNTGII